MSHDSLPKSRTDSASKDHFKWHYNAYHLIINMNQHFPERPLTQQGNIPRGECIDIFLGRIRVPEFLVSIAACKQFEHNNGGVGWDQNRGRRRVVRKVEVSADAILLRLREMYNCIGRGLGRRSSIVKRDGESCIE